VRLPARYLVHTVSVEPCTGSGAYGNTYGPAFTLTCMAQGGTRVVKDPTGADVVASLTLYAAPGQAAAVPPQSRVTWQGTTTAVINSTDHDSGGLGAPDHTEVVCE